MSSTFTVILTCIVFLCGKNEADTHEEDANTLEEECMDEKVEGLNCTELKLTDNCDPKHNEDAIFCQKTCNLCNIDYSYFGEECMDDDIEGVNCTEFKLKGNCDPKYNEDAIFCWKTCDLCRISGEYYENEGGKEEEYMDEDTGGINCTELKKVKRT
ncbi:hypothetical protein ACH3XW_12435 [Acanthocheilonema viteae]